MIQDIAPHTYHNEYKPVAPDKESHILAYEEGKILMKKDGETITLPSFGELEGKVAEPERRCPGRNRRVSGGCRTISI